LNAVLQAAKGREDAHLIQTVILRTMKQAVYSPDNIGHFGLAQTQYAHFTSPIRRYPDLMVHRAIRHVLRTGGAENFPYSHDEMGLIGEHCSNNERLADEATRDATDWLKCEYMQDHVGEVFDGVITSVTSFGLFIELKGIFVEGLLHITALDKDFYRFDPIGHRLVGERGGKIYRLGDSVTVQVARVDLDDKKIEYVLPREQASEPKPMSKGRVKQDVVTHEDVAEGEAGDESADGFDEMQTGRKKRRRRKKGSSDKGGTTITGDMAHDADEIQPKALWVEADDDVIDDNIGNRGAPIVQIVLSDEDEEDDDEVNGNSMKAITHANRPAGRQPGEKNSASRRRRSPRRKKPE
jgi:ribonuclease R